MSTVSIAELDLSSAEPQTFLAKVEAFETKSTKFGNLMLAATLTDETGFVQAAWFKNLDWSNQLKVNHEYLFEGTVEFKYGARQVANATIKSADGHELIYQAGVGSL